MVYNGGCERWSEPQIESGDDGRLFAGLVEVAGLDTGFEEALGHGLFNYLFPAIFHANHAHEVAVVQLAQDVEELDAAAFAFDTVSFHGSSPAHTLREDPRSAIRRLYTVSAGRKDWLSPFRGWDYQSIFSIAMASDAHAHPHELFLHDATCEQQRRELGLAVLASAWREDELDFHRELARRAHEDGAPPLYCAFGVHPQLLLEAPGRVAASRACLLNALDLGALDALGEAGLDAFGPHRATLEDQIPLFLEQVELAVQYRLPLVLHLRRASAELFLHTRLLSKLSSLIVHSSPLTLRESISLLERGINAYFSFGTPLLKGKRSALEALAQLPPDRLLFETDAPFQGLGRDESTNWNTLGQVCDAAFKLRATDGSTRRDFETTIDHNFRRALGHE